MSSSDGSASSADQLESTLSDLDEQVRHVPTKERVDHVERKASRGAQIAVIVSILIALASAGVTTWNSFTIADNTARAALTEQGLESLEAANKKLEERGLPKIPVPDQGQPIDADALAAAAAAILKADIATDPNFKGPQGPRGRSGAPGEGGDTGGRGREGQSGSQGQEGPSPSDQRILDAVSAYCSASPARCQGPQGVQGEPGKNGADSTVPPTQEQLVTALNTYCGGVGDPCQGYPESFSYTGPLGRVYTCTDGDKDRRYTCS